jgi:DNA-directed RNA polymerase specialized sigma24 family protein
VGEAAKQSGPALLSQALNRLIHSLPPTARRKDLDNIAEHYLDPEVLRVVRSKARRLAGKYGFHRYEAEDIQQELVLDYLTRSKRFDPSRSTRHRFARLIIKRRIATLIESQMAVPTLSEHAVGCYESEFAGARRRYF